MGSMKHTCGAKPLLIATDGEEECPSFSAHPMLLAGLELTSKAQLLSEAEESVLLRSCWETCNVV